jgi:2-polyprenyl-6-hydroxyphenyl methylase/3-demethylubiquinone-9 3-methyltransferase
MMAENKNNKPKITTIDPEEIEKFSKMADDWWNVEGKFKPLHQFNPVRLNYFRRKICDYFNNDQKSLSPFKNLTVIDIGCGGGLISEPFARLGADVTAIDALEKNIKIASLHAEKSGLKINYLCSSIEEIADKEQQFDVVLALEIIEHVADVQHFISCCAKLVKKDGLLFVSTINRTASSLALAKITAEYILRWLPINTHQWKKFLKPSEVNFYAQNNHLEIVEIKGFFYNLFKRIWQESENINVNYSILFKKN